MLQNYLNSDYLCIDREEYIVIDENTENKDIKIKLST